MVIGSIGGVGISTYVVTRLSARQGQTPPVDAVDPVVSSQQESEEISWMEAMSQFASSGAVLQRLSILSAREASSSQSMSDPQSRQDYLRRAAENAGRPRSWQRSGAEEPSDESPRPDPLHRLIDVVTERAQGLASSQQWPVERMALLSEMLQQFRGDIRQATQSFDSRTANRDDFLDQISNAFARFNRSFESDDGDDSAADEPTAGIEDALADSPIPPETLRTAFAAELANLRMTLSEADPSGQSGSQAGADNLQIEQYRTMQRQRLEQMRAEQYQPQLNAVA